jgi:hypothetical protein
MKPRELNEWIRRGVYFWVRDPRQPGRELHALKAKSVADGDNRYVKVQTEQGWFKCDAVRRAGEEEWIPLEHEGVLIWAIN